ncbi:MAG: gamma-glutamylcyclotransferase [Ferruginibacter sp.]|nr:gamma-glutamylcyclotransferase [Ferruginibacter sp.]
MQTPSQQLFVYGSLRSGFRNPVYQYLTKYFRLVGEAVVHGKFYDKGPFPVAIPTAGDSFITGELYAVNNPEEFNWAIEQLDDYEGLNVEAGEKPLYKRELVTVFREGTPSLAWIYWYNESVDGMKEIATGDVLKYLQEKNKP